MTFAIKGKFILASRQKHNSQPSTYVMRYIYYVCVWPNSSNFNTDISIAVSEEFPRKNLPAETKQLNIYCLLRKEEMSEKLEELRLLD